MVSASRGHRHWLVQRISAIVMAIYSSLLPVILINRQIATYTDWKAIFASHWFKASTLLFLISLFIHAWIGISDVLNDYISSLGIRSTLQKIMEFSLLGYTIWSVWILWNS